MEGFANSLSFVDGKEKEEEEENNRVHRRCLTIDNHDHESTAIAEIALESSRHKQNSNENIITNQGFKWADKLINPTKVPRNLRIFTLTWNMYGSSPPEDLSLLLPNTHSHHIIAISSQECLRSIGKSFIYSSKKSWELQLSQFLQPNYSLFASGSLGSIHLAIFISNSIQNQLSVPLIQTVKTGFGNVVANKGGVGIKFYVGNTSLLFISCHLASGQTSIKNRNQDFARIEKNLLNQLGSEPASDLVDACIYMGDFNYRINARKPDAEHLISVNFLSPLRSGDQLSYQMIQNPIFFGFQEGLLDFAPTYKFNAGSDIYDTSQKKRIPSWTDRIIYKSKKILQLIRYDSINTTFSSDHRPVYAQFKLEFYSNPNSQPTKQSKICVVT